MPYWPLKEHHLNSFQPFLHILDKDTNEAFKSGSLLQYGINYKHKRLIVHALILAFCLVKGQCHKHLTGKFMTAPK
jgi:hypothetical protein